MPAPWVRFPKKLILVRACVLKDAVPGAPFDRLRVGEDAGASDDDRGSADTDSQGGSAWMDEGGFAGDGSGDTMMPSLPDSHVVNWLRLPSAAGAIELRERAKSVPKGVIALEQLQAKRAWTDAEARVVV